VIALLHFPTWETPADSIYWDEGGTLREQVAEESYVLGNARLALYKKPAEMSWEDMFRYLAQQDPWFDNWEVIDLEDESPKDALSRARAAALAP